jgi:trimeric autotransporter adhesin
MKPFYLFIFSCLCVWFICVEHTANGQSPLSFPYQAVARDQIGNLLVSQAISVRFSLLDGGVAGTLVYQETHALTTNSLGGFSVNIGQGIPLSGLFAMINWGSGSKYIKVELDVTGGNSFTEIGTTQLMSVPYALYANQVGSAGGNVGWSLNGNSATNAVTDFIGTIDNQPLNFRVNNTHAGQLSSNATSYGIGALLNGNAPNSVAFGENALNANSSGDYNSSVGKNSLQYNQSGTANTANGFGALTMNLAGNGNTAIGGYSLFSNTASYNTATGSESMLNNSIGTYNMAAGYSSLRNNTIGNHNTACGSFAMFSNTSGELNTAMGRNALAANETGSSNVAIGATALQNNSSGSSNIAIGRYALNFNTVVNGLVAVGDGALMNAGTGLTATSDGSANTAVGYNALHANTNGYRNTALGYETLWTNTEGERNTGIGYRALYDNISGNANTAIGPHTLGNNISGNTNSGLGFSCLGYNTTGSLNVALGYNALNHNNGNGNVGLGVFAMSLNETGIYNTGLGTGSSTSGFDFNYSTAIGYNSTVTGSNQMRLGNFTPTLTIGGFAPWSNYSDGRFKENINKDIPGLAFIRQLEPVSYTVNTKKLDEHVMQRMPDSIRFGRMQTDSAYEASNQIRFTGFIAQDVEALASQLGFEFDGIHHPENETDHYTIAYSQFIMPLVKGMQEQQAMIETQYKQYQILSGKFDQLQQQLAELQSIINSKPKPSK